MAMIVLAQLVSDVEAKNVKRLYGASVMDSLPPVNGAQRDKRAYTDASAPKRKPQEVQYGRGRVSCIDGI